MENVFSKQRFWINLDNKSTERLNGCNSVISDNCTIFYMKLFGMYYTAFYSSYLVWQFELGTNQP